MVNPVVALSVFSGNENVCELGSRLCSSGFTVVTVALSAIVLEGFLPQSVAKISWRDVSDCLNANSWAFRGIIRKANPRRKLTKKTGRTVAILPLATRAWLLLEAFRFGQLTKILSGMREQ